MEKKLTKNHPPGKKIFILHISQGEVERGAERFVIELSKRLDDHKVRIISGNQKSISRWPILWRLFIDPSGIKVCFFTLKNIPLILKEKPEIVIPFNGGWMSFWVRLTTWLYGGKVIISGNSGKGWDDRINLWSFPNTFVALSERAENWAKKVNPFVKVIKIPVGVDTALFNPNAKPISVNLPKPIILGVGALENWKRWDLAIKAVSKLNKGSFLLVGRGELEKKLKTMGEKYLPGRFLVKSFPLNEMPRVYPVADVFTYPTTPEESFGLALVEAMASNLPVVATNDPVRKEIVGDSGITVDPTDIKRYTSSLNEALKVGWGGRPRKQAEKYDWDKIAKKYEKLFVNLIK